MALYVGTNYHPHDWDEQRWSRDIELMKAAGFNTVRLGHLCWDSYEPEEGVYTFEWFDKVMNLFADAGIGVVLDISMRPAPVWVHKLCPGCNIHGKSGNSQASLRRYMEDVDDPAYQMYAFRFADKLVNRYKNHPALFAFGLCNELGAGYISYSEAARRRFANWLKKKYGTVERLNEAWAARRWSRKLTSFDDVALPENEVAAGAPEAWLDMRRFFAAGIENFTIQLSEIVKKQAPGVPHSANHYSGKETLGFDYLKICDAFVDYPGIGFYPGYEDEDKLRYCMTVVKERLAETGKPMWCLEFQSGCNGIYCAPPGVTRMYALLNLLNRSQMLLAWTWRSMLGGEEQFYFGVLDHDGTPTPNYADYQQIAADVKKLEEYAFPYLPNPEIGVAFSQESAWVSQYSSNYFRLPYTQNMMEVQRVFDDSNQEYNMIDLRQIKNEYKLVIVPGHVLIDEEAAAGLRAFVASGGTVVMTGYSGTVDITGKVYSTPRPGALDDVFGIRAAGFYPTDLEGFYSDSPSLTDSGGRVHELLTVRREEEQFEIDVASYEILELKTASCFAKYSGKDLCAVSKHQYGKGTAYYVAAETNHTMLSWLLKYLTGELGLEKGLEVPEGIQARRIAGNQYFYVNTTNQEIKIDLKAGGRGILSETDYSDTLILKAYEGDLIVSSN